MIRRGQSARQDHVIEAGSAIRPGIGGASPSAGELGTDALYETPLAMKSGGYDVRLARVRETA